MYLSEYQKISVESFMGIWNRGSYDDIPPDHAVDCHNMAFARKREVVTRPGASLGRLVNGDVVRQFLAEFDNGTSIPIHADGVGNIWRDDNNTTLLTLPGMYDMSCLNMNNHVFIAPITSFLSPGLAGNSIYVWSTPLTLPRLAGGIPPGSNSFSIALGGGGHTGPGWYGISISWVFDTGFVSAPAALPGGEWKTTVNEFGLPAPLPDDNPTSQIGINGLVDLAGNAPPGATHFIIWVTVGQQDLIDPLSTTTPPARIPNTGLPLAQHAQLFQYTGPGTTAGMVALSAATDPFYLDFYDTDLTVAADSLPGNGNIYNLLPALPTQPGVALQKYHGRMIIFGTTRTLTPDPNNPIALPRANQFKADRVWISNAGQPESFDGLTGFVDVNSEFDGNLCRTGFELFGNLYMCKAVGTFVTQDNGSEPNDPTSPWIVNIVDGGIGAYHHSVGTITGSQPSLSFNSTAFLANRNGLFLFNGTVLRPELSWKIRGIWQRITHNFEYNIRVAVDIFNDLFYVMLPVDFSQSPNLFLMGDYSLGLDSQSIRWTIYSFPWTIHDIMMASYTDPDGVSDYFLRLGTDRSAIYRLDGAGIVDNGVAIDNWYQCAPMAYDQGALNIFRFIRYRMAGNGTMLTTIADQGQDHILAATDVHPLSGPPGNYKDFGIQINFTNEKATVRFEMNDTNSFMRMARVDVFGKSRWPTRPNG
jgi:hypothetical protein